MYWEYHLGLFGCVVAGLWNLFLVGAQGSIDKCNEVGIEMWSSLLLAIRFLFNIFGKVNYIYVYVN